MIQQAVARRLSVDRSKQALITSLCLTPLPPCSNVRQVNILDIALRAATWYTPLTSLHHSKCLLSTKNSLAVWDLEQDLNQKVIILRVPLTVDKSYPAHCGLSLTSLTKPKPHFSFNLPTVLFQPCAWLWCCCWHTVGYCIKWSN